MHESEKLQRKVATNKKISPINFRENLSDILRMKGRIKTAYSRLISAELMKTFWNKNTKMKAMCSMPSLWPLRFVCSVAITIL
jgi:hypothetical protein